MLGCGVTEELRINARARSRRPTQTKKEASVKDLVKMPKQAAEGVVFPLDGKGVRSTTAAGKRIFAAAAAAVDHKLSDAITSEPNWRKGYEKHLVKLAEMAAVSPDAALKVAEAGLAAVYSSFDHVRSDNSASLPEAMSAPSEDLAFSTGSVSGSAAQKTSLEVPFEGNTLSGDALLSQLDAWSKYGCMEPGVEAAIKSVVSSAGHLDLRGRVFVVLGATSALGPLEPLLQWGATVVGVARPKASSWSKLMQTARSSAGKLVFPVRGGGGGGNGGSSTPLWGGGAPDDAEQARTAGADLMTDAPEVLAWLRSTLAQLSTEGASAAPPTVGMYTYLDGEDHVRVTVACDAIMRELCKPPAEGGCGAALAYIQTPSLAYDIPADARDASLRAYSESWLATLGYAANARPPVPLTSPARYVHDGMMNLQGPNYALAKTVQMWRALMARCRDGVLVSANTAPAARTASMVAGANKNAGSVAAALDGMEYFRPLVVFDQETVSACMAALLVHDVSDSSSPANPRTPLAHPNELFSKQCFHGGTFRLAIKPSQLGTLFFLGGKLLGKAARPQSAL